jgi:hypothetical protein
MDKLDRLGWAAGFSFITYGVKIGVRSNDPSLVRDLEPLLPPGWRPASSPQVDRLYSLVRGRSGTRPGVRALNVVYGDITRIARTSNIEDALERFESDLQLYVAESARRRVFVHAGVAEWANKAIIIPGRSYSGKTTLVAELVRAGARFYSDEYAVFDPIGLVHPYPKALSVRDSSGNQKKCLPESLGGSCGRGPIPVGVVVVSNFKAGAVWRPRTASTGRGVLDLLANTVAARRKPETSLNTFRRALDRALILRGARGEAQETAASILKAIDASHK